MSFNKFLADPLEINALSSTWYSFPSAKNPLSEKSLYSLIDPTNNPPSLSVLEMQQKQETQNQFSGFDIPAANDTPKVGLQIFLLTII